MTAFVTEINIPNLYHIKGCQMGRSDKVSL